VAVVTLEDLSRINPIIEHRARHLGRALPGRNDESALRGQRQYVADLRLPGMLEVTFVRSPLPHANITSIDTSVAEELEGVVAVVTGADMAEVGNFPHNIVYLQPVDQRPLADERVRYVGAPYAVVVATDRYVGEDAAALVIAGTEFESLPTVSTIDQAVAEEAPRLYDEWSDNYIFNFEGNRPEVRKAFEEADHTFTETYTVQRHNGMPMETRGIVADVHDGQVVVRTSTQSPHIVRTTIATVLDVPESRVRVVVPPMGGGFGTKTHIYPEEVVMAWLALRQRRPLRWIEDRAEHLVSAVHAREQRHVSQVAYDDDGTIRGIRHHIIGNVGSGEIYMPGTAPTFVTGACITGGYDLANTELSLACVVTNKTPSGAYRGFGIPEGIFVVERIIDRVAQLTGVDRVELRRRLILREDQMPYMMPGGGKLDSGSHSKSFERALEMVEPSLSAAKAQYTDDPDVRVGVGYANYVEPTAPSYHLTTGHWAGYDAATMRIDPDGTVRVSLGVTELGQGADTTAASIAAEALGVNPDQVTVVMGDTDKSPYGLGAWGSRSAITMAGSIVMASNRLLDKAATIAAHMLQESTDDPIIPSEDIMLADGAFYAIGNPEAKIGWNQVATAAWVRTVDLPEGMEPGLEVSSYYDPPELEHILDDQGRVNGAAAWGNGAHAGVVSVRLSTGEVKIEDYIVVHDCGTVLNPTMVEGQVFGGVAQGIGGTMLEELKYDEDTGQPQFASFMEYMIPTITEIPRIRVDHFETFAPHMPLGVKGCGEGGTVGPPAVLVGAVSDALSEFGIDITSTPLSPDVIRDALRSAYAKGGSQ
jgi:carbon-monoxide dehydrogenase large subunit